MIWWSLARATPALPASMPAYIAPSMSPPAAAVAAAIPALPIPMRAS